MKRNILLLIILLNISISFAQHSQEDLRLASKQVAIERKNLAYNSGAIYEADSINQFLIEIDTLNYNIHLDSLAKGMYPINDIPISQNPYFIKVIQEGTAFLLQPPQFFPKAVQGTTLFSDLNITRSLVRKIQEYYWLLVNPQSPYVNDQELFKRYLRLIYATTDDYFLNYEFSAFDPGLGTPPGQGTGDWFSAEIVDCWRSAYLTFGELMPNILKNKIFQCANIMGSRLFDLCLLPYTEYGYANRDIYYGLCLYASGLMTNNNLWLNRANQVIDHIYDQQLLPDGAYCYIGNQNETAAYHGLINKGLIDYNRISGYSPAIECVSKSAKWELETIESCLVSEYYSAPAWKSSWDLLDGISTNALASISDNQCIKTFYGIRESIERSNGLVEGAYYQGDEGFDGAPIPNNYLVFDRNVNGLRSRNNDFSFGLIANNASIPNNLGLHTVAGGMTTRELGNGKREVHSALMDVYAKVHLNSGSGNEWNKWAYMLGNVNEKISASERIGGVSLTSRLYRQSAGPNGIVSNWSSFQQWISLDDRIIGLIEVYPKDLMSALAYEIDGRIKMGYGTDPYVGKPSMIIINPGSEYLYGNYRIIIHEHNFTNVDTASAAIIRDDGGPKLATEIRLRFDLSNNGVNLINYPGNTKKYYIVEVRAKDLTENVIVQKVELNNVRGLVVSRANNKYSIWRNLSLASQQIDISSSISNIYPTKVFGSRNDSISPQSFYLTSNQILIDSNEQILVISSNNPLEYNDSFMNFDSLIGKKPSISILNTKLDNTLCSGDSITIKTKISNLNVPYQIEWYIDSSLYAVNLDSLTLVNVTSNKLIYCKLSFLNNGILDIVWSNPLKLTVSTAPTLVSSNLNLPVTAYEGCNLSFSASSFTAVVYNWVGPNNFFSRSKNNTISNLTAANSGTYYLTVSQNGCNSNTIAKQLNVLPFPQPHITGSNSICNGNSEQLNVNAPSNSTKTWFKDNIAVGNLSQLTVNESGFYSVNVSIGGCTKTSNIHNISTINLETPTINTNGLDEICDGDTVNFSTNYDPSYYYNWYLNDSLINGINNSIINATEEGVYKVKISKNGCSLLSLGKELSVFDLPNVFAGNDMEVCLGDTVFLQGNGAETYLWDSGVVNGSLFVPNSTNLYSLIGIDSNGCAGNDQVLVEVNDLPIVDAGSDISVCIGDSILLNATGAEYYVWENNLYNNQMYDPIVSGFISVEGTDVNGCINTDSIYVVVNQLPSVHAGQDTIICNGQSVFLNASGADFYVWEGNLSNGQLLLPNVSDVISVEGIDYNGCKNIDSINVVVNDLPNVEAGLDVSLCLGDSLLLNGIGASTYIWEGNLVNGQLFWPVVSDFISVEGTDVNGCKNSDSLNVTVFQLPLVNAGPDLSICIGDSISLIGNGADIYVWEDNLVNGQWFWPVVSDFINVEGTDVNGCKNIDSIQITVNQLPMVDAGQDIDICFGDNVTLSGVGAENYIWDNNVINNAPFVPISSTYYNVIGIDANGCKDNDEVLVTVYNYPNDSIYINENGVLTVTPNYFYQWIDCSNNSILPNENENELNITYSGSFAAIISNGTCQVNTECIFVDYLGKTINESNEFKVSPNPTNDIITLEIFENKARVQLLDTQGRQVMEERIIQNGDSINLNSLKSGTYILTIQIKGSYYTKRIVKL